MVGFIVLGVLALVLVYLVILYNGLVRLRALVREGFSGITVQLRRRADLVPNLVATVQGYATHEGDLFKQVTARRTDPLSAQGVAATAQADAQMTGMLGRIVAVAEAYPTLKADANFRQLQEELSGIETELAGARRYYNATVRDLNSSIQSFPSVLVASPLGFKEEEFYADDVATLQTVPRVQFDGQPK
ncbi:LemA family protein [uncultured Sphingomonas sp.]|uniref:LemA family protein n=1 Tax=uncultured Sphingomonas sp. TaxID=158754 RepID=UPI0035CC7824